MLLIWVICFIMHHAFNQDIGSWDVSNVTNMSVMFDKCSLSIKILESWDVSSVTDMKLMF